MTNSKKVWGIHLDDSADTLEKLAHSVYLEVARKPANVAALKHAMIQLLSYLASPENRTDDNCTAIDTFFCIRDHWETDWHHLLPEFQRILEDMGGALHDTVSSPKIAGDFESTPEQLLERVFEIQL
jgi:hypothetical protein